MIEPDSDNRTNIHEQVYRLALFHLEIYLRLRGSERFATDAQKLGHLSQNFQAETPITEPAPVTEWGGYKLDRPSIVIADTGRTIRATTTEFNIMQRLVGAQGHTVNTQELSDKKDIRIHVLRLRRKFLPDDPIQTVRGFGYRLTQADKKQPKIS
jgi:DNA-binding response OmpR family regulator